MKQKAFLLTIAFLCISANSQASNVYIEKPKPQPKPTHPSVVEVKCPECISCVQTNNTTQTVNVGTMPPQNAPNGAADKPQMNSQTKNEDEFLQDDSAAIKAIMSAGYHFVRGWEHRGMMFVDFGQAIKLANPLT